MSPSSIAPSLEFWWDLNVSLFSWVLHRSRDFYSSNDLYHSDVVGIMYKEKDLESDHGHILKSISFWHFSRTLKGRGGGRWCRVRIKSPFDFDFSIFPLEELEIHLHETPPLRRTSELLELYTVSKMSHPRGPPLPPHGIRINKFYSSLVTHITFHGQRCVEEKKRCDVPILCRFR